MEIPKLSPREHQAHIELLLGHKFAEKDYYSPRQPKFRLSCHVLAEYAETFSSDCFASAGNFLRPYQTMAKKGFVMHKLPKH